MRLALLGLSPLLLASLVLPAQQTAPANQQPEAQAAPAAVGASPAAPPEAVAHATAKDDDAIARGQAKAAERAVKDKAKADSRVQKKAEKAKKEAEEEAKFLKLQDNEIVVATYDEQGNPVKLPPCSKKDKECQAKRKELLKQKKIGLNVQNGTLTVDGWTGKARLNYDVKNFQYLYVSVPGYGTIVASPDHFPGSNELKDALDGQTLTITTKDDRTVQLASDVPLSGKQKRAVFYSVDRAYQQPGKFPSVGYGFVNKAPYVWPGTLPPTDEQRRQIARAPVLPQGMEVHAMTLPCQIVGVGESPKPIKINGILVTPPACASVGMAGTPGAFGSSERPPDGSGAASTGIAENHTR